MRFPRSLICAGLAVPGAASLLLVPVQNSTIPASHSAFNGSNSANHSIPSPAVNIPAFYGCDAKKFGNPSLERCLEAYNKMPSGQDTLTYGDRTVSSQPVDIPLPVRYVSSEGSCVIDILIEKEGGVDEMKPGEFKKKVRRLIKKCLELPSPGASAGGYGGELGERNLLSVYVRQSSTGVKCFTPTKSAPKAFACQTPLSTMPVSASLEVFGERGTAGVDVGLPLRFTGRTILYHCAIDVVIDGPPVKSSWYNIWGAAEIVVAVCAASNKDGVSIVKAGETELAVWASSGMQDAPGSTA